MSLRKLNDGTSELAHVLVKALKMTHPDAEYVAWSIGKEIDHAVERAIVAQPHPAPQPPALGVGTRVRNIHNGYEGHITEVIDAERGEFRVLFEGSNGRKVATLLTKYAKDLEPLTDATAPDAALPAGVTEPMPDKISLSDDEEDHGIIMPWNNGGFVILVSAGDISFDRTKALELRDYLNYHLKKSEATHGR